MAKPTAAASTAPMQPSPPPVADRFERLQLDLVDENPRNTRKHFDKAAEKAKGKGARRG